MARLDNRNTLANEVLIELMEHVTLTEGDSQGSVAVLDALEKLQTLLGDAGIESDEISELLSEIEDQACVVEGREWFRRGVAWGIKLAKDPSYLLVLGGNDE